jgi:trehalose 6-phosphate synthase
MRPTVRLIVAISLAPLGTLGTFPYFQVQRERAQLETELQRRAALLGESLREATALRTGSAKQAQALLKKFARDDRAIAVFDRFGSLVAAAPGAASRLPSPIPEVTHAIAGAEVHRGVRMLDARSTYVYATPIQDDDGVKGALVVLLDASHVDAAGAASWQHHAIRFVVAALGVSLITLLIVRMTFTRPLSEIAAWTRTLKTGPPLPPPGSGDARLFGPLALEVSTIARKLHRAQAAAEQEAALRLAGEAVWAEERLKQFVRARFGSQPLFIVTNRQPLSHVRQGRSVVAQTPASGVVTALEPVARACGAGGSPMAAVTRTPR